MSIVRRRNEEQAKSKRAQEQSEPIRRPDVDKDKLPDITLSHPERAAFLQENHGQAYEADGASSVKDEIRSETDHRDNGGERLRAVPILIHSNSPSVWIPGQGVQVDYAAIVEILILQLDNPRTFLSKITISFVRF